MYVEPNIEARSVNHCCNGKAISITYSDYVSVALDVQHAMIMRHIANCGLSSSTIFPYYFQKMLKNTKCVFSFPL
jgi:hypothetical protein